MAPMIVAKTNSTTVTTTATINGSATDLSENQSICLFLQPGIVHDLEVFLVCCDKVMVVGLDANVLNCWVLQNEHLHTIVIAWMKTK